MCQLRTLGVLLLLLAATAATHRRSEEQSKKELVSLGEKCAHRNTKCDECLHAGCKFCSGLSGVLGNGHERTKCVLMDKECPDFLTPLTRIGSTPCPETVSLLFGQAPIDRFHDDSELKDKMQKRLDYLLKPPSKKDDAEQRVREHAIQKKQLLDNALAVSQQMLLEEAETEIAQLSDKSNAPVNKTGGFRGTILVGFANLFDTGSFVTHANIKEKLTQNVEKSVEELSNHLKLIQVDTTEFLRMMEEDNEQMLRYRQGLIQDLQTSLLIQKEISTLHKKLDLLRSKLISANDEYQKTDLRAKSVDSVIDKGRKSLDEVDDQLELTGADKQHLLDLANIKKLQLDLSDFTQSGLRYLVCTLLNCYSGFGLDKSKKQPETSTTVLLQLSTSRRRRMLMQKQVKKVLEESETVIQTDEIDSTVLQRLDKQREKFHDYTMTALELSDPVRQSLKKQSVKNAEKMGDKWVPRFTKFVLEHLDEVERLLGVMGSDYMTYLLEQLELEKMLTSFRAQKGFEEARLSKLIETKRLLEKGIVQIQEELLLLESDTSSREEVILSASLKVKQMNLELEKRYLLLDNEFMAIFDLIKDINSSDQEVSRISQLTRSWYCKLFGCKKRLTLLDEKQKELVDKYMPEFLKYATKNKEDVPKKVVIEF